MFLLLHIKLIFIFITDEISNITTQSYVIRYAMPTVRAVPPVSSLQSPSQSLRLSVSVLDDAIFVTFSTAQIKVICKWAWLGGAACAS